MHYRLNFLEEDERRILDHARAIITAGFRRRTEKLRPDLVGSQEDMAELNEAKKLLDSLLNDYGEWEVRA